MLIFCIEESYIYIYIYNGFYDIIYIYTHLMVYHTLSLDFRIPQKFWCLVLVLVLVLVRLSFFSRFGKMLV